MATQTLTLGGRKFVVIPQAEYRLLKAKATRNGSGSAPKAKRRMSKQDRGDVAESIRRLAEPGRVSLNEVTRKLGFKPDDLRE